MIVFLKCKANAVASDGESPVQASVMIDADACEMGHPRPINPIFSIVEEQGDNLIWMVTSSPHSGFFP